jgi:hypothetical protein
MAGYLAHWKESLDDPDTKIMRPQQVRDLFADIISKPTVKLYTNNKRTYLTNCTEHEIQHA